MKAWETHFKKGEVVQMGKETLMRKNAEDLCSDIPRVNVARYEAPFFGENCVLWVFSLATHHHDLNPLTISLSLKVSGAPGRCSGW